MQTRRTSRDRARPRWSTFASRLLRLQHSFLERLIKDVANGGRSHPALGRRWKRVTACGRTPTLWRRPAVWRRPDRLNAGGDAAGVASVTGSWQPVMAYASRRGRARSLSDTGLHTPAQQRREASLLTRRESRHVCEQQGAAQQDNHVPERPPRSPLSPGYRPAC